MTLTQVMLNGASTGVMALMAGWAATDFSGHLSGQTTQKISMLMEAEKLTFTQASLRQGVPVEPLSLVTAMVTTGLSSLSHSWTNFVKGNFRRCAAYGTAGSALLFFGLHEIAPHGLTNGEQLRLLQTVAFGVFANYGLRRCIQEFHGNRLKLAAWSLVTAAFWFTLASQSALNPGKVL